ncbi:hypothetical protein BJ999_007344 [Actinomadura citrea]|uniref:Uncharacterized protein n=1 Tax=Actinomadura citrea TaxID=46158 RepID=A0A7Y9KIF8_9ACTN|nr:hypothetical protein [Actinomadura citrea]GGT59782.1 hypothetical protein GCM10010177_15550 [Actinomadura citrea]
MLYVLGLIIALAVLGPLFGADSRDGLDRTPNNFWLRRRRAQAPVRRTGSPGPASGGHASAGASRTIPAAG